MRTRAGSPFAEIKDAEAHVEKELLRIFERSHRRDQLVERHMDQTVGSGWIPLSLQFDKRVSAYHMPSKGPTKAVVALNLGCEGSALSSAPSINDAREKGVAFLAFSMVTREAAGGSTREQIAASVASNAWFNISTMSPLHQLYNTERIPTFLLPQSAAAAMTLDNLTHEGFARRMGERIDEIHFVVPFFDASGAGTIYPLEGGLGKRSLGEAYRQTRNGLWSLYANIKGGGELGTGFIDRWVTSDGFFSLARDPKTRMPTRKEGRALQLYARDVVKKLEGLPADHPLYQIPMTSWMSSADEASCPHSANYVAELLGADQRTDKLKHMNLKKRVSWIISDIEAGLGVGETNKNLPPLTLNRRPEPTVEDIVRQTGGYDPDVVEAPIGPPRAVLAM